MDNPIDFEDINKLVLDTICNASIQRIERSHICWQSTLEQELAAIYSALTIRVLKSLIEQGLSGAWEALAKAGE
ncbi:MAG: hypothetical protein IJI45_00830 [Anaerolineaceae bacterium]|nr:hypothetical protein [Anaerolineaceae bacterium]